MFMEVQWAGLRYQLSWAVGVIAATLSAFAIDMVWTAVGENAALYVSADEKSSFLAVGLIIAIASAPVWPFVAAALRVTCAPRGVSDALAGALLGAAELALFAPQPPSPGALALVAAVGAAGGLAFWLAAGRPRPPYSGRPLYQAR